MEIKHCINCMEELEGDICKKCGFDQNQPLAQPTIALKCNTVLHGRYLVGKMLGQGGFGITYIGFDLLLSIKVCIKEYLPLGSASRDSITGSTLQWHSSIGQEEQWKQGCESFLKEARKMAKLDSIPGIVRVRDTFYENQTAYIVMDFIEGTTLKQYLMKNGTMPYRECIQKLAPLMTSLAKVHEQGLIHRDISPDNIMMQQDGHMMLLDLGAAKDISVNKDSVSQLVTKHGFSPAEQYMEHGSIGPWTDVYAFCATIYYCVYGKVIPDAMDRMMDDPLVFPPAPSGDFISENFIDTLRLGLSIRSEERIQTMGDLQARLAAYSGDGKANVTVAVEQTGKTNTHAEKKKRKKPSKKVIIPIAAVLVCAITAVILVIIKPWRVTVERLGNSNSNILNDGGLLLLENEYEYFLDHNQNLKLSEFDETDGYFYVDEAVIVAENAYYINEGKDVIYFAERNDNSSALFKMNHDGSNIECLYDELNEIMLMQYVQFSNDEEYLYFVEGSPDGETANLQRYNLATDAVETLVADDVCWYNLYGDSLYYTLYNDESGTELYKSNVNGKHAKLLDDEMLYTYGFIENETIYLYSYKENVISELNLDGELKQNVYDAKMDVNHFTFAYGDGWIYYVGADDGNLYQIREDGTGNNKIVDGKYFLSICVSGTELWLLEGENDAENYTGSRVYMAYKDGTGLLEADEADVYKAENGLLYKKKDGSITICGYEGIDNEVGIPYIIDDIPVTDIEPGCLPSDVDFYIYASEDELDYDFTEDGSGVVITGYNGDLTELMLPDTIEDTEVVGIGESAFAESNIEKIVLGSYVQTVNDYAFENCAALSYVKLPASLNTLGMSAFGGCTSLAEITIPNAVTTIDSFCFYDTQITHLAIPANVQNIGSKIATNIAADGFSVDTLNQTFAVKNGVLFTKDMTTLISFPDGAQGGYFIPASVKTIAGYAFFDCDGLTSLQLEQGSCLETIGTAAISFCDNLTLLDLSESGTTMEENAIYYCENLTEIYFPRNMTYVPSNVCSDCGMLQSVTYRKDCDFQAQLGENVEVRYYEEPASEESGN